MRLLPSRRNKPGTGGAEMQTPWGNHSGLCSVWCKFEWMPFLNERWIYYNMIDLELTTKRSHDKRIQQRHPQLLSSQNLGCQTKQILSQSQGPRIAAADGFLGHAAWSSQAWRLEGKLQLWANETLSIPALDQGIARLAQMSRWEICLICFASAHHVTFYNLGQILTVVITGSIPFPYIHIM